MRRAAIACLPLALLLSASPAPAGPDYSSVRIEGVPHIRQRPDFCGEACVAMWLGKLGVKGADQDWVFARSGLESALGRGCRTAELRKALASIGFEPGRTWHRAAAAERQFAALHADLLHGIPSIVCMYYQKRGEGEHFRLVLGYDAKTDEVIYHEPAEDKGAYRKMKREEFLKLWPLGAGPSAVVIRMPLAGGGKLAQPPAKRHAHTAADFAQKAREVRHRIEAKGLKGFTVLVQPPFVVVGDESPAAVEVRATRTVKWAVDLLKKDYFRKDPNEILEIWLFRGKDSYRKHAKVLFDDEPSTPFGYYSSADKALVMNISTGGGTLVHEIVHPFMRANFPNCPSWFDEGLASLYEQCGEKDGKIVGYTNWRLAGLQAAIRKDRVPSFKALCGTTRNGFYNMDPGTNYAQARYLCYYLQQKGLLGEYYRAFRDHAKDDPTGYKTLRKTLGGEDMDAFKKRWEKWVLELRYP